MRENLLHILQILQPSRCGSPPCGSCKQGRALRQAEGGLQTQSILSIRRTGMYWTFFVVSLTRSHTLLLHTLHLWLHTPHAPGVLQVATCYAAMQRLDACFDCAKIDRIVAKHSVDIAESRQREMREGSGGRRTAGEGWSGSSALSCFNRTHRLSNKSAAKFGFRCMEPRARGSSDALWLSSAWGLAGTHTHTYKHTVCVCVCETIFVSPKTQIKLKSCEKEKKKKTQL